MSDVQFEEDPEISFRKTKKAKKSGSITAWIIKSKLAKDEKQANQVLIVIAVLCFVTIGVLYYVSQPKTSHEVVPLTPLTTPGKA